MTVTYNGTRLTLADFRPDADGRFACPECSDRWDSPRGVYMHFQRAHLDMPGGRPGGLPRNLTDQERRERKRNRDRESKARRRAQQGDLPSWWPTKQGQTQPAPVVFTSSSGEFKRVEGFIVLEGPIDTEPNSPTKGQPTMWLAERIR